MWFFVLAVINAKPLDLLLFVLKVLALLSRICQLGSALDTRFMGVRGRTGSVWLVLVDCTQII